VCFFCSFGVVLDDGSLRSGRKVLGILRGGDVDNSVDARTIARS
jgi:hypothetical protein